MLARLRRISNFPLLLVCCQLRLRKFIKHYSSSLSSGSESKMKVEKITNFLKMPLDKNKKKKYDEAVLQFIVSDGRPLESTVGAGFKNLCKTLTNDSYVPPVPTTLSRHLNDLHHTLHLRVVAILQEELTNSYLLEEKRAKRASYSRL